MRISMVIWESESEINHGIQSDPCIPVSETTSVQLVVMKMEVGLGAQG